MSIAAPDPAASPPRVAVVGGGPAGLMAAEVLAGGGCAVELFDAMPSVGRKFLLAGRGGLNITHAEDESRLRRRYGAASDWLEPALQVFGPRRLREWVHALGIDTFVGSSGRVFPEGMKSAPLLRAWLHRLRGQGVRLRMRHRWTGFEDGASASVAGASRQLGFDTPEGHRVDAFDAVVLALGGASWSRLGSDGRWWPLLAARGVPLAPLQPANCGVDAAGSAHFSPRFAGAPVKSVAAASAADAPMRQGEFVVTATGVEGSLVYALAAELRDRILAEGSATLWLDLLPDRSRERVQAELDRPRGARSLSNHWRARLGLTGVKAGLLRECAPAGALADPAACAALIKALPLRLLAPRPIDEAISSAGGVRREACGPGLMLDASPGVFCAGEMLDWEAPTGGYLLTACLATGRLAGEGALQWLAGRAGDAPAPTGRQRIALPAEPLADDGLAHNPAIAPPGDTMTASTRALFQPLSAGPLQLANRLVMAPMTRSFAPEGVPTDATAAYYARRAAHDVGLIITEGTLVERPAAGNDPAVPRFYGEDALAGWGRVVQAVKAEGGRIWPQLWHVGALRSASNPWRPSAPFESPSGVSKPGRESGVAMTEADVADTIAAFARAAGDAMRLGFDGIELHGAHGYLIDQFFWGGTNQRGDRWGGATLAERSRFAAEVIAAARRATSPDFPIAIRLSQWKQQDFPARLALSPQEMESWLRPLVDAGVDVLHCSQRRFWEPEFEGSDLNFAGWAKKLTGLTTITVGSVGLSGEFVAAFGGEVSQPASLDELLRRLERGDFDLVAVGRALISDPAWGTKVREGRFDEMGNYTREALATLY